jgi:hypothetical protein
MANVSLSGLTPRIDISSPQPLFHLLVLFLKPLAMPDLHPKGFSQLSVLCL